MAATPYLFFSGNCADAMRFYQQILGGKLELITYGESPDKSHPVPEEMRSQIMHARLATDDGAVILASDDGTGGAKKGMSGFAVTLSFKSVEETTRVFRGLEEGAT